MNKKMKSIQVIKSLLLLFFGGMALTAFTQDNLAVGKGKLYDLAVTSSNFLRFDAEEVNSAVSLEHFLVGRVPGLSSQLSSGNMSEGGILSIRGDRSLNATNQPLIILDGMLYECPAFSSIISGYSENLLKNINVKDVDHILVIKDATAQFGSKGANGVILIETKKAKNVMTLIDFTAYTGVNTAPRQIPMLDANGFRSYANEFLAAKGLSANDVRYEYKWLNMDPSEWDYPKYSNNTNWQDELYSNAFMQDYHLGIKGGDAIAKYALSVGYLSNGSSIGSTNYQRYTTRMNGDLQITKQLKLVSSIGYTFSQNDLMPTGLANVSNPILNALLKPAVFYPYDILRSIDGSPVVTSILSDVDVLGFSNPTALINNLDALSKNNQFTGMVDFQYELSKSLSASAMVGINYAKISEEIFTPSMGVGTIDGAEYIRKSGRNVNNYSNINSDVRLNYNKQIAEKHHFNASVGSRFHTSHLSNDNNSDYSMPNDEFKGLGSGSSSAATTALDKKRITSNIGQWKTISNYVTANYDFASKYYVSLGAAADVSSQFSSDQIGIFPSANLAWKLTEEEFLKGNSLVSEWKLRAGFSVSGNDNIGYYTSKEYYEAIRYRNVSGLVKENLQNDNLKWETTQSINIGTDFSLLKSRLMIGFDYFTMKNDDIILFESLPAAYGYDGYWKNSATTGTNGWELSVNFKLIDSEKLKWNVGANLSQAKSKVISLPGGTPIITDIPGGQLITKEGGALYQFYGYKSNGVYASNSDVPTGLRSADGKLFRAGDMNYAQVVDDQIINSNDRQVIGKAEPDLYGGIQTSLLFKGISLNASFDFKSGNQIFNYARMQTEGMNSLASQSSSVNMRWTAEGDQTEMPRVSASMPENATFSSRWIEEGAYLRFRSLNFAYDIPIKKGLFQGLKLFCQADNLFMWTNYLGSYPEFNYGRNQIYQGVDYMKTPQSASVVLGVKLGL
jgi:TonB-linked SusC/RagA family outer membrane protein